jgi:hypothetical protein
VCPSRRLPRTSPDAPTTHRGSFRFLPMQPDKPNRIVGRFREPPARQRLKNTTVVCAISSGYEQPSKAAPLQAPRQSFSKRSHRAETNGVKFDVGNGDMWTLPDACRRSPKGAGLTASATRVDRARQHEHVFIGGMGWIGMMVPALSRTRWIDPPATGSASGISLTPGRKSRSSHSRDSGSIKVCSSIIVCLWAESVI